MMRTGLSRFSSLTPPENFPEVTQPKQHVSRETYCLSYSFPINYPQIRHIRVLWLEGILGRFPGGDSLRDKSIDLCGGFLGYHVWSAVILVGIESGAAVVFAVLGDGVDVDSDFDS